MAWCHYCEVITSAMASQITSLTIVYSTVYSGAYQRKHQSSTWLAFVRGIHRWLVNSPHEGPVMQKCFHLMTSSCHRKWWWRSFTPNGITNVQWVNSSPPGAPYIHQWIGSALVQIMAYCLSKPVLVYCQLDCKEQTSVKFSSKYQIFHSRKCIWKCRLQNTAHFVSDSTCVKWLLFPPRYL